MRRTAAVLLLAVSFTLALASAATAQTVVRGTVTDAATGAPLAAATVQVEGTFRGTITNADGEYVIAVEAPPATLLVRFIGYATGRAPVAGGDTLRLDVALTPAMVELETVTVTGANPAENIMRQVIERKAAWWDELETYAADAYTRFTLENDTGIVSIVESLSRVYGDTDRGTREVVRSRRQTANLPIDDAFPAALFVTNFYADDVEIAGYRFIGVTHPDALRHYDVTLTGTRYLDDALVYDIAVRPKSRLKTAFVGRVAVLADVYALLEVELEPSEAFLFPPPIDRFDVTYAQQYSNYGGPFWLPVDFRSSADLRIAFGPLLSFPDIHVDQVSRLSNYEVNVVLPDTLFEDDAEVRVAVDSAAVAADTLLDAAGVTVPLAFRERVAYASIDSTMTLERAYEPRGPLARFVTSQQDEEGVTVSAGDEGGGGAAPGGYFSPQVWYDRVEAVHVGGAAGRAFGPLSLGVSGGYGTGLPAGRAVSYGGEAALGLGRATAWVDGQVGVRPRYETSAYPRLAIAAVTLLGGDDYFDYLYAERLRAGVRLRLPSGVRVRAGVERAEHEGIGKTTDFDLTGRAPFRPNPLVPDGTLKAAMMSVAVGGDAYSAFGLAANRRFVLRVEAGRYDAPGYGNGYARAEALVETRVETFFRRRLLPHAFDLRLTASTSMGDVPLTRTSTVDGALAVFAPFGVLHTRTGRPYEGTRHVALFWEHTFRTLPFELAGLFGVAQKGYTVLVRGAHAYADADALGPAPYALAPTTGHHEVGVGLSGLFGLLRLDVSARLDEAAWAVRLGPARLF